VTTSLRASPAAARRARASAWLVYAVLASVAMGVYFLLPRAGVSQGVLLTTLNATAAVATFLRARRTEGLTRLVWTALGMSMTFSTLANGPYYAYPLITGRATPFPCVVDVFWLLTYPCFAVALVALSKLRRREERRGNALDSALLTIGGAGLMWVFVIAPIVRTSGTPLLTHIVSVAYPVGDLLVFAMLVRLVVVTSTGSTSMRLLLASFGALLASDTLYALQLARGLYRFGGPTDGLWMVSYALIAVAALHPTARRFPRPAQPSLNQITRGRILFLCGSALTPLLLTLQPGDELLLAYVSLAAFLIVIARLTGLNRTLATMSRELETQATTDDLTKLSNRVHLYKEMERARTEPKANRALLLIDLDEFKAVNDVAGHSAGDALLVEVAARLRSVVRPDDVVARLGGDEFAVMLRQPSAAASVAQRIIDCLRAPFCFAEREFVIGASVGLVIAHDDTTVDGLMQSADIAMYAAKRGGKNRVVTFDESMRAEVVDRDDLARDLQDAIERGNIRVEYQPIVRLDTGATIGLEALARWRHDRYGDIAPARFIPIAEESGVIAQLGCAVLEIALRDLARIDAVSHIPLELTVNLSARQLQDNELCADVANVLARTRIDAQRLTLEVTESAMIDESSVALERLHELRSLGVQICIDDFGTGYSSLAYLRRLPVGGLKIDRAFVDGIDRSVEEAAVARAILRIGDTLGLRCVAEGVERKEQIGPLRAAGCEFAQGFYFARPMGIEVFLRRMARDARPATSTSKGTVLIVDVAAPVVAAVERRLHAAGFESMRARSASEATDVMLHNRIDVVVVDLSLADGDAMELCRAVRADRSRGYVPLLAVSEAGDTLQRRMLFVEIGADSVMDKPFDPSELTATIRSLLRARAAV
jgi:diguanylate cyclase (GGDEF)-like protein